MTSSFGIDATQIRTWLRCRRRWFYGHGLSLEPNAAIGSDADLLFGSQVHASLEQWDSLLATTSLPEEEILLKVLAGAWAATASWEQHPDLAAGPKSRDSLIRLLIWYAAQFGGREDPIQSVCWRGEAMVEIPFSVDAGELAVALDCPGLDFGAWRQPPRFTGRFDGLVWGLEGEAWVHERKTTAASLSSFYFARYHPEVQTSLYPIVARYLFPQLPIQGVLLEAIQTGVGFSRVQRVELRRHPEQLQESLAAFAGVLREMAAAEVEGSLETGSLLDQEPLYPLNEASCTAGGRPCQFRELCLDRPANRQAVITANWHTRTPWNPLDHQGKIKTLTGPVETRDLQLDIAC